MASSLDTSAYAHAVVIDTHVVLEAKPLDQLPWPELFPGTVLLLVCRQVQSEIDAKKNDGRLGTRARAFNKLLDAFLEGRTPTSLLAAPQVNVALMGNRRIDWSALDDLDPDDGDDRIVAQALHGLVDDPSRLAVLSHDMRPRDGAATHGLRAVKMPETWLKEPEPSPERRRIAELEERLRLLSADQPKITVTVEAVTPEPWTRRAVEEAKAEQTEAMVRSLLARAPKRSSRDPYDFGGFSYDSTHSDRLDKWRDEIRRLVPTMNRGLERLFAQHRIRIRIENVGTIPAEGLSLEIRSGNTVLHATPYWILMAGPAAPQPRFQHHHLQHLASMRDLIPQPREQFTFHWDERGPGDHLIVSCASFRQEKTFEVEVSVELLANTGPRARIEAVVTAANLKGDARGALTTPVGSLSNCLEELYDPERHALVVRPPFDLPRGFDSQDYLFQQNDGSTYREP